jgi:hypothetical protein
MIDGFDVSVEADVLEATAREDGRRSVLISGCRACRFTRAATAWMTDPEERGR